MHGDGRRSRRDHQADRDQQASDVIGAQLGLLPL